MLQSLRLFNIELGDPSSRTRGPVLLTGPSYLKTPLGKLTSVSPLTDAKEIGLRNIFHLIDNFVKAYFLGKPFKKFDKISILGVIFLHSKTDSSFYFWLDFL